jgi:hypothetical protein
MKMDSEKFPDQGTFRKEVLAPIQKIFGSERSGGENKGSGLRPGTGRRDLQMHIT